MKQEIIHATMIDLDTHPSFTNFPADLENVRIVEHKKGGEVNIEKRGDGLYVDGYKVSLFQSEHQIGKRSSKVFTGNGLLKELDGKPVLNACLLDFLKKNKDFIPDEMKRDEKGIIRNVWFLGTIYEDGQGLPLIRGFRGGGEFGYYYTHLQNNFNDSDFACHLPTGYDPLIFHAG